MKSYAEMQSEQRKRWLRLGQANMEDHFLHMMALQSDESGLSSTFNDALRAIQVKASPIVIVMPKGMKRSILLLLSSWLEPDGTTLVVVPSTNGYQDIQEHCRNVGMTCAAWVKSDETLRHASVVLMSLDSAMSDVGSIFVDQVNRMRLLDRIVICDCDALLAGQPKLRTKARALGALRRGGVQVVMISATLTPHEEGALWRRMGWTMREVKAFRIHAGAEATGIS